VGQLVNCCPFVDDRLRQLLMEEMMNVHQPILPNITTIIPNVFVVKTQAMDLTIGYITIPINY
jgi:hypothetical protein